MKKRLAQLSVPVNGEEIKVRKVPHLRCPSCHEIVLRLDEAKQLGRRALDIYREKYGLLSAAEIRSIRERLGMTQAELATLLCLGGNTISRWEAGRKVQSAAHDVLLRLIRDVPESLAYLRSHAA